MKDSDPRPMPSEVARAYRDPLELGVLFATEVFTDQDRFAVRDELLRRLVGKYGNAEIESGSKLATITQRVAKFKKNPWKSIDLLMSVPEYGGKESVKLELAHVMQPYWSKWWKEFDLRDWNSLARWNDITTIVMGDSQLRWLNAQYVRSVINLSGPKYRNACLEAIESAEAYASDPSEANLNRMIAARVDLYVAPGTVAAAAIAALAYSDVGSDKSVDLLVAGGAVYAAAARDAASRDPGIDHTVRSYRKVADLTRQLITPTLITSASRGLR